jgi:hypothetical protein
MLRHNKEELMKYIVTVSLALLSASPAFAAGGNRIGGLIGSVTAPITTAVSALNVNALNNVSILSGNSTAVTAVTPVSLRGNSLLSLKNNSLLSGLLGGGSHGCGCN